MGNGITPLRYVEMRYNVEYILSPDRTWTDDWHKTLAGNLKEVLDALKDECESGRTDEATDG